MKRTTKLGIGMGLMVLAGAGLVWWGLRSPSVAAVPPHQRGASKPSAPAKVATAGIGTVAWATAMRSHVARQWGTSVPPLWIAPDQKETDAWFVLAPLAHGGALWWAVATPKNPLPRLRPVSTTLNLSTAEVDALPKPIQGVLTQAYDLMHDRPWALTQQVPPIESSGAMTATQAEARGVANAPVAWSVIWEPPIPALGGQKAQPGAANFVVTMPWHAAGEPDVLISENMEVQSGGRLVSGGDVTVYMNGQTLQPIAPTDITALEPGSVATGLSGPGK